MDIKFIGFDNVNWFEQRRYRKIMFKWIEDHLNELDDVTKDRALSNLNQFQVRFFPTNLYKEMYGSYTWRSGNTGNLSDDIPHEIVGKYKIDLFMYDVKDTDMRFPSNLIMMSHGLGHALLYSIDPSRRSILKYDDASGNKAGKEMAWHTAAVHSRTESPEKSVQRINDREIDNEIYYLQTYRFSGRFWQKRIYRMYDFRDDIR